MVSPAIVARLRARQVVMAAYGRVQKPKAAIPVARWPAGARLQYLAKLLAVVDEIERAAMTDWIPKVPALLRRYQRDHVRTDAAADGIAGFDPQAIVRLVEGTFRIQVVAADVAASVASHNKEELNRQFRAGLGFDLLQGEEYLADPLDLFAADNVRLVRKLTTESAEELRGIIVRAIRSGSDLETVRKEISARIGIARNRAALIARDQVGSLNAELTKLRQTRAGVTQYVWRTAGDERVRPGHRVLNGETIRWDDPPIVDPRTGKRAHAGEDINCRCVSIPKLEGLRSALIAA